jgi:predicted Zn-dependent peptidase
MFKKVFLNNVMETAKDSRSVCLGICVKTGSRNEEKDQNGISHFLEHMFFKGTAQRTTKDIAVEIDSLGGELNAFTSRESTTFYIKVLDEHIEKALELLTDIFLNSVYPEEEIEKEKGVIFEEINLVEDTPEDYIHDMFNKHIWGESGLGLSVLGGKENIKVFTKNDLLSYVDRHYGTKNILVSCSGNIREESLIENLNRSIGNLKRKYSPRKGRSSEFRGGLNIIPKKLSEVHVCLGVEGLPQADKDRYAMHLLNTILGAGVSSRLFLEIREKRGLAYSIGSYNISYFDTGVWTVYTGTDKKNVDEVVKIVIDQIKGLSDSLTSEELIKAKNQLKGSLFLALESTSSKMVNITKQEMYYGKYFSPEEIINAVESVSPEEVKALSKRLVEDSPLAITVYGPVREKELLKKGFPFSY